MSGVDESNRRRTLPPLLLTRHLDSAREATEHASLRLRIQLARTSDRKRPLAAADPPSPPRLLRNHRRFLVAARLPCVLLGAFRFSLALTQGASPFAGDAAGKLLVSGLPLEGKVALEEISSWLGQDSFVAGLRIDGRIERFVDGAKTERRYSLASMNSKGEVLVVQGSSPHSLSFFLPL